MTVAPSDEPPRAGEDPAFRDAVTFAFGDPETQLYGLARVAVGGGRASAFAVVFAGGAPVGATSDVVEMTAAASGWDDVEAAGVRTRVLAPLGSWTVTYDGAEAGFDLRFEAISAPAQLDRDDPVARAGGSAGYEQLCEVSGTVRHGRGSQPVRSLGQRGHQWGTPDWGQIELARTVCAWLAADRAVSLTAVRAASAKHHDDEAVAAFVIDGGEPHPVFDPRLSTTYDHELRQRRASLELWMEEEGGVARRAAGQALCGTTIELGELRLQSAFFVWRMEGREGVGRYDVLRRVAGERRGGRRPR